MLMHKDKKRAVKISFSHMGYSESEVPPISFKSVEHLLPKFHWHKRGRTED